MHVLPHATAINLAAELAASTNIHYVIGYNPADDYATNLARSIGNATYSNDLTVSEDTTNDADGLGVKISFGGKTFTRTGTATNAQDATILFVDGSSVKYGIDVTPIEVLATAPSINTSAAVTLIRNQNPAAL